MKSMKWNMKLKRSISMVVSAFISFMLFLNLNGCNLNNTKSTPKCEDNTLVTIESLGFDNNKFLFRYGMASCGRRTFIYDVAENKFSLFSFNFNGKEITDYKFSRNGRKVVFAAIDQKNNSYIYIMNSVGSDVRRLTTLNTSDPDSTREIVGAHRPSFSPDEKHIIFIKKYLVNDSLFRNRKNDHINVFELDIKTGKDNLLTRGIIAGEQGIEFINISPPYYLSDGKGYIIGSRDGLMEQKIFVGEKRSVKRVYSDYKFALNPQVADNGFILFCACINLGKDGYPDDHRTRKFDLIIDRQGKTERLTKIEANYLIHSLSKDGKRAVFFTIKDRHESVFPAGDTRIRETKAWVINTDGTGLREIIIPWEQLRSDYENHKYSISINASAEE